MIFSCVVWCFRRITFSISKSVIRVTFVHCLTSVDKNTSKAWYLCELSKPVGRVNVRSPLLLCGQETLAHGFSHARAKTRRAFRARSAHIPTSPAFLIRMVANDRKALDACSISRMHRWKPYTCHTFLETKIWTSMVRMLMRANRLHHVRFE